MKHKSEIICSMLYHRKFYEWRQKDNLRALYCPRCKLVLTFEQLVGGEWK